MIYEGMPMHLHTCHQPGGSMEGHIYNAKKLGMRYIRFTDHDTRTGKKKSAVESFDFFRGVLKIEDENSTYGFDAFGGAEIFSENGAMKLSFSNEGNEYKKGGASFSSSGTKHTVSLIAQVDVTLGLKIKTAGDAHVYLDVRLSQRPPDHKPAHLIYAFGDYEPKGILHSVIKPIRETEDGIYRLALSDDMRELWEIGGLDNVFDTLLITVEARDGGSAECIVDRFEIKRKYTYDDVIVRQRKIADKIGEKYGVKPFVTTEISGAGQHKNVFSTSVPVIDYEKRGYSVTEEEAVEHVKRYGGIFAYNHPFENEKYKALKDLTEDEVRAYVEEESASLIEKKVYGATLMEVGFPCGRGCFGLSEYLSLWDKLSLAGIFITGYGDSDSHYNDRRWFDGNNFASWIAVPKKAEFPVSEEVLIRSMKAGDVYMGDPVLLKSEVSFTSGMARMGSVIIAEKEPRKMYFSLKNASVGSLIRVIVDGELLIEDRVESEGDYSLDFELEYKNKVSFARVEMYDENGRCIMLTNPIYLVSADVISGVAEERRFCNYVLREKADAERFSAPYTEDIEIPSGVYEIKGKKLLHIGDTHSENYPYFKRLIELVSPDIILHTGDLADEVKAGRIPYTGYEYERKIRHILKTLEESGARVIIVPGNNDIREVIERLIPTAEVYAKNSVIEIDGIEVRVGHQVTQLTYDRQWAFYGHGFTGEKWSYSQNEEGKECRFNACLGAFVVSLSENKFYMISVP